MLDERRGGPLGIVRIVELSRIVQSDREAIGERWTRLFGAPSLSDPYVWTGDDGPAIRIVADDSLANRVLVEVNSISAAAAELRRLDIPFAETDGAIAIDSKATFGLRLKLVGRTSARGRV